MSEQEIKIRRKYWSNGQLRYEHPSFVNGKAHGINKGWFINGFLQYIAPIINGEWHGFDKNWSHNGCIDNFEIWRKDIEKITVAFNAPLIKNLQPNKPLFTKELWKILK